MTQLINTIDMNLSFNENTVRVVGSIDNPLFVVTDICKILGLTNTTHVLRNIPQEWQSFIQVKTGKSTSIQTTKCVNESGLYKIIMRCRKPIVQPFQNWVCGDVLPSIRKKGEYCLEEYKKRLDEQKKITEEKEEEIKKLKKKYIKPPKEIFNDKNVIYLMTTKEGEKEGEYAVGKATDLTKRKESYNSNKLHDFKVVYHKPCKNAKFMDLLESVVLMKLEKYRSKAGRDVFLLPKSQDISVFTNIFDKCVAFYEDINNAIYPKRTKIEDKKKRQERNQKYYKENKDKIKENMSEFYEDNKESIAVIGKVYYEENKDKIQAQNKKYYEDNREAVIETNMKYYEDNKEKILEDRKESYKDNKEKILEKRKKYHEDNYKTKIKKQRSKKETCECGMVITHYCMKKHKKTARHATLMAKKLEEEKQKV